jgi:hypothetical protein
LVNPKQSTGRPAGFGLRAVLLYTAQSPMRLLETSPGLRMGMISSNHKNTLAVPSPLPQLDLISLRVKSRG